MEFINYITENALILIPVLYIIGMILKDTNKVKDKHIPLILLPIGICLSMALMGIGINALIQGVLVVGVSVYTNQLVKQINK